MIAALAMADGRPALLLRHVIDYFAGGHPYVLGTLQRHDSCTSETGHERRALARAWLSNLHLD